MGMNLIGTLATAACGTPGPAYLNISAYTGIKFWAKGDGQAYIIKIPLTDDCNTSVTGYDDYAYTFTAPSANWTQVIIPFTAFTVNTWGSPPANIGVVLASARALQWCTPANMSADLTADLWVDDIQFY
jgi:hypothetical protein